MWQALGGLLPIAVAVAFSSVPITMTILILLSPNRNRAALPFLVGWVIGVAAVIVFCTLFASTLPQPPRRGADPTTAVPLMVVGAALIVLGVINLRRGPQDESKSTGLQVWLSRVDSFGVLVSFAVAVLLNLRPKGLLLGMAAGLALHATSVKLDEALVLIGIYTVIATSTVVIPIVASLVAPRRMEPKLVAARDWMTHNGRLLTSLMMFIIGVVILGYGLTQL
jgi:Sap, sulfolipid-1-addressing protein